MMSCERAAREVYRGVLIMSVNLERGAVEGMIGSWRWGEDNTSRMGVGEGVEGGEGGEEGDERR